MGDTHGRLASATQAASERCHGTTWQGQEVRPGQERCPLKRSVPVLRPSILEGHPRRDQGPRDKEPFSFC